MTTPNNCPECGKPMDRYTQPGFGLSLDRDYETCWTKACRLNGVTKEAGDHATMTKAEIDTYQTNKDVSHV